VRARFINEDLSYMRPEFQGIIDLLENHDLHFDPDSIWGEEGEQNMSDQGYPGFKSLVSYSFEIGNSLDVHYDAPLNLEILTDLNDNKFFQFYFDASPIVTGSGRTLTPDHQPLKSLDEDFVLDVVEHLNNM